MGEWVSEWVSVREGIIRGNVWRCIHVRDAVANCIILLLNWFEIQRTQLCFERACIGKRETGIKWFWVMYVQLRRDIFIFIRHLSLLSIPRFTCVKVSRAFGKLRNIFGRNGTEGVLLNTKIYKKSLFVLRFLFPKLSKSWLNHFRNATTYVRINTDLLKKNYSGTHIGIAGYCM